MDAADILAQLTHNYEIAATIAAAGAIPPLVQLLGAGDTKVQRAATFALGCLSKDPDIAIAIGAAGAIPPLVNLLGSACEATDMNAAGLLRDLAEVNDEIVVTIAAAGAIPPLVQLRKFSPDDLT
ncbi:hypothetical protein FOA52_002595 [Chlamydomonas sp. UWO 241]|nr:hypothetical protein FOA52_002595 [Chlamydomonas sp. UWO 241]